MTVLRWRNDERVAKFMKNKSVSEAKHRSFISNLKNDATKRYFLVKEDGKYVGVIDFMDISARSCEFGIYANPQLRGVGKKLMNSVLGYAFIILDVRTIKCHAFKENERAISLYQKFDFKVIENDENFSFLQLVQEEASVKTIMKNYKFLTDDENRQLLEIRNLEHIRNMSQNDKVIDFEEHKKWLKTSNGGG